MEKLGEFTLEEQKFPKKFLSGNRKEGFYHCPTNQGMEYC